MSKSSLVKSCLVLLFLSFSLVEQGIFATTSSESSPKASVKAVLDAEETIEEVAQSRSHGTALGKGLGNLLRDVVYLHVDLFNWDTIKVFVGTFPLFIGARMIDDKVHSCFYDPKHHKNVCQMHDACYHFAKNSLAIPIVVLGSGAFWAKDENFRETSRVFLIGMPFVIWSKEIIKKWRSECCKRPWNEHFSCHKQAYGGFPSGHMAEIMYSTVLFGKRLGPKVGIPLGFLSLFLGVNFINCNRHYLSQIIAGAGLGTMYALAADKLVSSNLEGRHPFDIGVGVNEYGAPELQVGVSF